MPLTAPDSVDVLWKAISTLNSSHPTLVLTKDRSYVHLWVRFLFAHFLRRSPASSYDDFIKYVRLNRVGMKSSLLSVVISMLHAQNGDTTKAQKVIRQCDANSGQPSSYLTECSQHFDRRGSLSQFAKRFEAFLRQDLSAIESTVPPAATPFVKPTTFPPHATTTNVTSTTLSTKTSTTSVLRRARAGVAPPPPPPPRASAPQALGQSRSNPPSRTRTSSRPPASSSTRTSSRRKSTAAPPPLPTSSSQLLMSFPHRRRRTTTSSATSTSASNFRFSAAAAASLPSIPPPPPPRTSTSSTSSNTSSGTTGLTGRKRSRRVREAIERGVGVDVGSRDRDRSGGSRGVQQQQQQQKKKRKKRKRRLTTSSSTSAASTANSRSRSRSRSRSSLWGIPTSTSSTTADPSSSSVPPPPPPPLPPPRQQQQQQQQQPPLLPSSSLPPPPPPPPPPSSSSSSVVHVTSRSLVLGPPPTKKRRLTSSSSLGDEQPLLLHHQQQQQQHAAAPSLTTLFPSHSDDDVFVVNSLRYLKLDLLGKGGSSKVFKCLRLDSREIVAIKSVRLNGPTNIVESFLNEVDLLKNLQDCGSGAHIIRLFDSEVKREVKKLFLVMECGDVDLNVLLKRRRNRPFNMNLLRLYWQQMLEAVLTIHNQRVVHGDLKPANFLLVKGCVKLIDFGIAKAIQHENTTNIYRETQVGTLNYMSPEALKAIRPSSSSSSTPKYRVGRSSDVWSLGCILSQMVTGEAPFARLSLVQKLQAITDERFKIKIPPSVPPVIASVLQMTLRRKPQLRASLRVLLKHPFVLGESAVSAEAASEAAIARGRLGRRDVARLMNRGLQFMLSNRFPYEEKKKYAVRMIEKVQKPNIPVSDLMSMSPSGGVSEAAAASGGSSL